MSSSEQVETALKGDDPFALFDKWMADAVAKEPDVPDAMALATADKDGLPDVRMVLLKEVTPAGFVFFFSRKVLILRSKRLILWAVKI